MKLSDINFNILNKWLLKHSSAWAIEFDIDQEEIKSQFILLMIELERKGSFRNKIIPFGLHHTKCVLLTRCRRAKRRGGFISIEELKAKGRDIGYEQDQDEEVIISEFEQFIEEGIKERRYPEKIKDIIALKLKGYSQTRIESILDIPQYMISKWLRKVKKEMVA